MEFRKVMSLTQGHTTAKCTRVHWILNWAQGQTPSVLHLCPTVPHYLEWWTLSLWKPVRFLFPPSCDRGCRWGWRWYWPNYHVCLWKVQTEVEIPCSVSCNLEDMGQVVLTSLWASVSFSEKLGEWNWSERVMVKIGRNSATSSLAQHWWAGAVAVITWIQMVAHSNQGVC